MGFVNHVGKGVLVISEVVLAAQQYSAMSKTINARVMQVLYKSIMTVLVSTLTIEMDQNACALIVFFQPYTILILIQ